MREAEETTGADRGILTKSVPDSGENASVSV